MYSSSGAGGSCCDGEAHVTCCCFSGRRTSCVFYISVCLLVFCLYQMCQTDLCWRDTVEPIMNSSAAADQKEASYSSILKSSRVMYHHYSASLELVVKLVADGKFLGFEVAVEP